MPPQEPIAISVSHIRKTFRSVVALGDVSLDFEAGLMHGVIGPEGAGKTTLMRLMLGLMKPAAGNIRYARGGNPAGGSLSRFLNLGTIGSEFPIFKRSNGFC